MNRPNILLIMTDEMRGDCLGLRHPDVKTPYLDTLAARGTLFDNAVTACPSCIAARASLMTGLSPASSMGAWATRTACAGTTRSRWAAS